MFEGGLIATERTEAQVALDLGPRFFLERLVDPAGDALGIAALWFGGQGFLPARAVRRRARPRWIRDMTVPIGTSRIRAIS